MSTPPYLRPRRRSTLLAVGALLAGLIVTFAGAQTAAPAAARPEVNQEKGIDTCAAPSLAQMNAFWQNTPYNNAGIYFGGSNRGCAQPNLTSAWVAAVTKQGWGLLPLYVGLQSPCEKNEPYRFSLTAATAYAQGKAEAVAAKKALAALGMIGAPMLFDLEAAYSKSTACLAAERWFIYGWVMQAHAAPHYYAGIYTSTCSGALDQYSTIPVPPDLIDAGQWDNNPKTTVLSCVSAKHWIYHQRHKQYRGGHNETWNGVTLNIDNDCSNAVVWETVHPSTTGGCV